MEVSFPNGEKAVLVKNNEGFWRCPVCGSPELDQPAYDEDGAPSFQMCSCGFEFGFDDDPGASGTRIESIIGNWEAWRAQKLKYLQPDTKQFKALHANLQVVLAAQSHAPNK